LFFLIISGFLVTTNPVFAVTSTTSTVGVEDKVVGNKGLIKKAKTIKEQVAKKARKLREDNKLKKTKLSAALNELLVVKKIALATRKTAYKAAQDKYLTVLKAALATRKAEYKVAQERYLITIKTAQEKYNNIKNSTTSVSSTTTQQ